MMRLAQQVRLYDEKDPLSIDHYNVVSNDLSDLIIIEVSVVEQSFSFLLYRNRSL